MRNSRHAALALAAAAGLLIAAPAANAAGDPTPAGYDATVASAATATLDGLDAAAATQRLDSQPGRVALGQHVDALVGGATAGFWLDQAADTVVLNVTNAAAAEQARAAGAQARLVDHSTAALESARDSLTAGQPADTAVGIDVVANEVVVQVGPTADAAAFVAKAEALGSVVRVERLAESLTPFVAGGDAITGASGGRCSLGFNTTGGVAVTAGHCTAGIPSWYVGGAYFGPSVGVSFPGNDYGLIRNDGGLPQDGSVNLYNGSYQDITGAADSYPGLAVCKSGSTTGLTCGTVYQTGVTICYAEGCVGDMVQTDTYAAPGDSGGSWFSGGTALGLTSGGGGGWTYYQPVVEALNAYGVSVI